MNIENSPLGAFTPASDKTESYLKTYAEIQAQRDKVLDTMTRLRPFKYWSQSRYVKKCEESLAHVSQTLTQSQIEDAQEALDFQPLVEVVLPNDTAAEHPVTVVDDSRLTGSDGAHSLV